MTLPQQLKLLERKLIEEELRRTLGLGRITRAAQALGISRKCLWEKMRRHGIDKAVAHPQEQLGL